MLDLVNRWLKSDREYFTGVVIYKKLPGHFPHLLELLQQGPTPFSRNKLGEALQMASITLQANAASNPEHTGVVIRAVNLNPKEEKPAEVIENTEPVNAELYTSAKMEADNLYKTTMNARAVLFNLARHEIGSDPNFPDKIEQRRELAIEVVKNFRRVSALYVRADYIKKTGKLPDAEQTDDEESDVDLITDIRVKQELDNLRKNVSKTKRKPVTAERTLKLQQWAAQIKILEQRWHSLQ